ncbi:hypothetical protein CORC01_03348 [Colletotrichum orchidophilum]|uniref:Uncharacterized protein n=1 Tax=Colletotrichum orchidophilum TaxID=1209926 RepID=A0A1G4BIV3_9PEZI|nr:uncharacterized protein CORC01_03348 [Colletotrichum orchidophilum]OHF01315.1 hypothetical protein CORC01_03348 [Colletotrichum orchidophilum]
MLPSCLVRIRERAAFKKAIPTDRDSSQFQTSHREPTQCDKGDYRNERPYRPPSGRQSLVARGEKRRTASYFCTSKFPTQGTASAGEYELMDQQKSAVERKNNCLLSISTSLVTPQPANEDIIGRESAGPPPSSGTGAPLTVGASIRWPQSVPAAPFKLQHILLTSHRPGGPSKPSVTGGLGNIAPNWRLRKSVDRRPDAYLTEPRYPYKALALP